MVLERFLVKSYGDNEEGTRQGLIKLIELCNKPLHGVIVVPTIGQVKGTILTNVLGEELSKILIKNREVILNNGAKISLCGSNTLKNYKNAEIYLALWASKFTIQDIETQCYNCKYIVNVTWNPQDAEDWIKDNPFTFIYDDGKSD